MKRSIVIGMLVLAALGLSGCGRLEAAFTPEPKVITDEATVAVAPATLEGELDKGVPEDTPLWPGSVVEASLYTRGTGTVTLVTRDPYDDVVGGTAVGYQRAKWDVATEDASEGDLKSAVITATKPGRDVLITITDTGGGTVTMEYLIQVLAQ